MVQIGDIVTALWSEGSLIRGQEYKVLAKSSNQYFIKTQEGSLWIDKLNFVSK